jgi:DNA-binding response OmpR family regulator
MYKGRIILVVENDPHWLRLLVQTLKNLRNITVGVRTIEGAMQAFSQAEFDTLLISQDLPDGKGDRLASASRVMSRTFQAWVMAKDPQEVRHPQVLRKPVSFQELRTSLGL